MRENLSYLLLFFIIFFLLAAILEVKFGLIALILIVAWMLLITNGRTDPIDNYLQLAAVAGTYLALIAAILASWVSKVKDLNFPVLSVSEKTDLFLELGLLSLLIFMGVIIATLFKLVNEKNHPQFARSRQKRFVDRNPAGKKN